jgi:type III secretion protein N (ATPase)
MHDSRHASNAYSSRPPWADWVIAWGCVVKAHAGLVAVRIPGVRIGDGVRVASPPASIDGHVCAIGDENALVAAHASTAGIARGTPVRIDHSVQRLNLGVCALGRAIDAHGRPLDGGPPLVGRRVTLVPALPLPPERTPVCEALCTGVRAIDGLLTLGRGARVGVFGAPGAGKSTLLESIVDGCDADAIVIGLIGERGREAQQWIARLAAHVTVVCATSDRPAAERARAAIVAAAHAAALRERGLNVLFVLDNLARVAAAWREVGVSTGESVGRGGYPPSVFADLARLVEVAGPTRSGSISLIASVLSDGDDGDPISDAARSLLDGHITLSRQAAQAGRFPAIDVLTSASRTMTFVTSRSQQAAAERIRRALSTLERIDDARRLGVDLVDPYARRVIAAEGHLEALLRQSRSPVALPVTSSSVMDVASRVREENAADDILPE